MCRDASRAILLTILQMYETISEAMVKMESLGASVAMNASLLSAELIPKAWDVMQPLLRKYLNHCI